MQTFEDPYQAIVLPAIQGTVGILKSAKAYGPDVQRVVITSSVVAMSDYSETAPALIPNVRLIHGSRNTIC